jgi:hypothetical protein
LKDPDAYSIEEKPLHLNLYNNVNVQRHRGASINSSTHAQVAQAAQPQAPWAIPYGFQPPLNPFFANPVQWPGTGLPQPPGPGPQANPTALPAAPPRDVRGPQILEWLQYCDHVPGRGDFFYELADKFIREGYRSIDQLTRSRMTVENLSNWLGIGKGTADLIIQYAEEDMALVRDGKFTMKAVLDGDEENILYV